MWVVVCGVCVACDVVCVCVMFDASCHVMSSITLARANNVRTPVKVERHSSLKTESQLKQRFSGQLSHGLCSHRQEKRTLAQNTLRSANEHSSQHDTRRCAMATMLADSSVRSQRNSSHSFCPQALRRYGTLQGQSLFLSQF